MRKEIILSLCCLLVYNLSGYKAKDLKKAKGRARILIKADLSRADLRRIPLKGKNLTRANLSYANLANADLHYTFLPKANLQGANLRGANLQFTTMRKVNLRRATLIGAKIQLSELNGAKMQGAKLQWAKLNGAQLKKANLRRANLSHADLTPCVTVRKKAKFSFSKDGQIADKHRTNLTKANLTLANLKKAKLKYAIFKSANFTRADLTDADLTSADLRKANLNGAKLNRTKLKGANLSRARVQLKWRYYILRQGVKGYDSIIWIDLKPYIHGSIQSTSGRRIRGARVEAWDSDIGRDNLMGRAITTRFGSYKIQYKNKDWDRAFGKKKRPDIYIVVYIRRGSKWKRVYKSRKHNNYYTLNPLRIDARIRLRR